MFVLHTRCVQQKKKQRAMKKEIWLQYLAIFFLSCPTCIIQTLKPSPSYHGTGLFFLLLCSTLLAFVNWSDALFEKAFIRSVVRHLVEGQHSVMALQCSTGYNRVISPRRGDFCPVRRRRRGRLSMSTKFSRFFSFFSRFFLVFFFIFFFIFFSFFLYFFFSFFFVYFLKICFLREGLPPSRFPW